jgi:hypothetical protein
MQIKSADVIAAKYATRGAAAGPDYAAGVNAPRNPWAASTTAASDAYSAGVQAAVANGSFVKGVTNAGDAKWQRKAAGVGAQRYPAGVTAAKQDYSTGVAPYLQVLAGLQLPPRGAKGNPGNMQRAVAVATALRNKKING